MRQFIIAALIGASFAAPDSFSAEPTKDDDAYAPHTPTLLFQLSGITNAKEADAICLSVKKLKSVRKVNVDVARSFAHVRFDSHVVSYHQVAQAIADAGTIMGKTFDPRLSISVPEYALAGNASKVDEVFAGKRLNQRVRIEPVDKAKGEFLVHFLPLQLDPQAASPQGFNGGHLHHPVGDPPPRGLGLSLSYASGDEQESGSARDSK